MQANMHTPTQHKHTFTTTLAKGCQIEGKGMCGFNESLARSQELCEVPEVSPGLGETPIIHNPVTLTTLGCSTFSQEQQCIFH